MLVLKTWLSLLISEKSLFQWWIIPWVHDNRILGGIHSIGDTYLLIFDSTFRPFLFYDERSRHKKALEIGSDRAPQNERLHSPNWIVHAPYKHTGGCFRSGVSRSVQSLIGCYRRCIVDEWVAFLKRSHLECLVGDCERGLLLLIPWPDACVNGTEWWKHMLRVTQIVCMMSMGTTISCYVRYTSVLWKTTM